MIDRNEARRRWAGVVAARMSNRADDATIRPGPQAACDAWGNVWDDLEDDPWLEPYAVLLDHGPG